MSPSGLRLLQGVLKESLRIHLGFSNELWRSPLPLSPDVLSLLLLQLFRLFSRWGVVFVCCSLMPVCSTRVPHVFSVAPTFPLSASFFFVYWTGADYLIGANFTEVRPMFEQLTTYNFTLFHDFSPCHYVVEREEHKNLEKARYSRGFNEALGSESVLRSHHAWGAAESRGAQLRLKIAGF